MPRHLLALFMLCALSAPTMMGCKNNKPDEVPVEKPRMALAGIDAYTKYLPADAVVLVSLDARQLTETLTFAMPPESAANKEARAEHIAALERDIRRASMEGFGVDVLSARRVLVAASKDKVAVLLLGEVAAEFGEESMTVGGLTMRHLNGKDLPGVMAEEAPALEGDSMDTESEDMEVMERSWAMALPKNEGLLIVSNQATLEALGSGKTLESQPERLARFKALYTHAPSSSISAGILLDSPQMQELFASAPFPAPQAAFVHVGETFDVVFEGTEESLNGIKTSYETALSAVGVQLANSRTEAKDADSISFMAASLSFHNFGAWRDSLSIKGPAGGSLHFSAPSPFPESSSLAVSTLGIAVLGAGAFSYFMIPGMSGGFNQLNEGVEAAPPFEEEVQEEELDEDDAATGPL